LIIGSILMTLSVIKFAKVRPPTFPHSQIPTFLHRLADCLAVVAGGRAVQIRFRFSGHTKDKIEQVCVFAFSLFAHPMGHERMLCRVLTAHITAHAHSWCA
jgi:hypothetical protein